MKVCRSLLIFASATSSAFISGNADAAITLATAPPSVPYTWVGCYAGGFGAFDVAHVEDTTANSRSNGSSTTTSQTTLPGSATTTSTRAQIGTRQFNHTSPTTFAGIPATRHMMGNAIMTRITTTTVTRTPVRRTTTVALGQGAGSYGRTLVNGDGGGRVGCNYQTGRVVVGAQLEGGYLGINGTTYDPVRPSTASAIGGGVYGAVTGRVGFAVFDRTLVYARGGIGYAGLTVATYDPVLRFSDSARFSSRAIPLIGAGLEYKLTPHVSLTGEYTYMRPSCHTQGYAFATTACIDKHMIAIGVNYYLFSDAVAVVAR